MPPLTTDSTLRIGFPPERAFLSLVLRSAIGHLRLYPLSRLAQKHVRECLEAVSRGAGPRTASGRGRLEMSSRRGTLRIVLRLPFALRGSRKLAALAARAPDGVVAHVRSASRSGALSIQAPLDRPD